MKFWQSVAFTETEQLIEVVKICEEVGFDGVMLSDHLLHFEDLQSNYPYSADGKPPWGSTDTPWPDCWPAIGVLAAVTKQIRFATNVYVLPLRNPIQVAKETATVAALCESRLAIGAGAGWMKEEFEILGVDFHTRGKRFNECIEVMRALWSGQMVEYHGDFFDFPRMRIVPVPNEPIPIYVGGMSAPALRRAAQLGDGWLGAGQTADEALETTKKLGQLRAEAGRDREPFEIIVPLKGPTELDDYRRLEDVGVGSTVSYPFSFSLGATSTLDKKRAYMERYANEVMAKVR